MRKKIFSFAAVFVCLLCVCKFTVNAQGRPSLDELIERGMASDLAQIEARGTLRVAIPSADLMAFFEEDENGNLSGVDIELAKNIAEKLKVKAEFVRIDGDYGKLTDALKSGKADMVIAVYSRSYDRMQYVNFSKPYLSLKFGVMVNKAAMVKAKVKSNPIPYMKENAVDLALAAGTSHVDVARQLFPLANIIETSTYEEAAAMVAEGKAFGTLSGELEFYSRYLDNPHLSLYVSTYTFDDVKDEFSVGVNRNLPHLLDMVNLYIETSQPITVKDVKKIYERKYGNR